MIGESMNTESLRLAIEILAEHHDDAAEYQRILEFTANLYRLPVQTVEQLVLCRLADKER
ncbi:MAG: hypothetical protein ABL995_18815 [Bryobacteraceae bacterium]